MTQKIILEFVTLLAILDAAGMLTIFLTVTARANPTSEVSWLF